MMEQIKILKISFGFHKKKIFPIHPSFTVCPHCYSQLFAFHHLLLGLLNDHLSPSTVSRNVLPHFSRTLNHPPYPTMMKSLDCITHHLKIFSYLPLPVHWARNKPPCLAYHAALARRSYLLSVHYCPTEYLLVKYSCFMSNYLMRNQVYMPVFNHLPSHLWLGSSSI